MSPGWRPTHALLRAALCSAAAALVAVLAGRPDLLVLAAPLALHAGWSVVRRPRTVPTARHRLLHASVREGEATVARTEVTGAGPAAELAVVALAPHRWSALRPASGALVADLPPDGERGVLEVAVGSRRWGRRGLGDGLLALTAAWGGFRWGPEPLHAQPLTTLPLPGRFDTRAPAPHPIGVVGTHPARRPGEGSELSSIRPFAAGDRIRRIQWPVSLRTGALHVTSTVAEQDAAVMLLVDSGVEIGESGGLGAAESSLDVAVRAAGAVAEHYLHQGDRVGLRVLGSTRRNAVATGSGRRHLRRILDTLAWVVPGERDTDPASARFHVPAGAVVLVFSPMLSDHAVAAVTTLARRGLAVVVVDCLPEHPALGDDRRRTAAWRMRLLEREDLLLRVTRSGIPVVAWRGPGTLDEVLRRLGRRAALPRLVRR